VVNPKLRPALLMLPRRRFLLLLAPFLALAACVALPLRAAEDERPVVNDSGLAPEKPAAGTLPTLWIAGDSTVKSNRPMRGWGQDLHRFFDPTKLNVVNHAIGGRSSRTFYTEGRWQSILDELKSGDWVLIQFGHNDVGRPDASSKFRGSVKGIGDETENVTKPDGGTEVVHSYGWYLKTMARSARAKGANVVLLSPVPHKKFDAAGKHVRGWDEWRGWVAACAQAEGAYFVDLCELVSRGYDKLPQAEIETFFADARTHTNEVGSLFNARSLVAGLRALPRAPLDTALSTEGKGVPAAR
jgi:rhamnogalacturonan acetylesterase